LGISNRAEVSRRIVVFLFLFLLLPATHLSCSRRSDTDLTDSTTGKRASSTETDADSAQSPEMFREVQHEIGLEFRHLNGGTGEKYFIEVMGPGGGFFDFDRDGWQDIYLVQSGPLPESDNRETAANRLLRNDRHGSFIDVTASSGAGDTGYGMGCCFGDYNNDGFPDIYVTNFGPNQLYRNNGDGTFSNVTGEAGVGNARWSASAAFADPDQDGDLDLYAANYVTYSLKENFECRSDGFLEYCSPDLYPGCADVFYRNNGDGTFTDVTQEAGLYNDHPDESKGLGVMWFDYDSDGDPDLYVANDSTPNFLYRNNGDGTFTDVAMESGVAYNFNGQTESSMGVDAGDYDWDGDFDIFVTHWHMESNTLYKQDQADLFQDVSLSSNLGSPSTKLVGWGTKFFDYDNDGWLDLFVANGHTLEFVEQISPGSGITFLQTNQLFENDHHGRFRDISNRAGRHFQKRRVGRGAAFGDVDNDGDLDILVVNNNDKAVMLLNLVGQDRDWIGFHLTGRPVNWEAIGARLELRVGGRIRSQEVRSGTSYLCQNDLRLVFGLGDDRPEAITVVWPKGQRQELDSEFLMPNQYHRITQPVERLSTAGGGS